MSSRGRKKPPALTPEESRHLDGQLPPDEARTLEHHLAADPDRSEALARYRDAMDVWRDDVTRGAPADDDLAERVLASIEAGRPASGSAPTVARWYAAAAAALIAVGIGGTVIAREARTPAPVSRTADLDELGPQLIEGFVFDHVMWPSEGGR